MLRGVQSLLAVGALAAVGLALRWVTAGTITAANPHDLDSLTVLAVGAVAWIAYGWLVLAVLATALEQLPGAIGTAAGLVARGITSKTSRALLRSALGVAAVTPLTVGMAQAATPSATHSTAWQPTDSHLIGGPMSQLSTTSRATAPRSSAQAAPNSSYRATEPRSSVELAANRANSRAVAGGSSAQASSDRSTYRATEPGSSLEIDANRVGPRVAASGTGVEQSADRADFRATEPRSSVQPGATGERFSADATRPKQATAPRVSSPRASARLAPNHTTPHTSFRATEPRSSVQPGATGERSGADAAQPHQTGGSRATNQRSSTQDTTHHADFRATEPASSVEIDANRTDLRATEPRSSVQLGSAADDARDGQVVGPRNGVRAGAGVPTARPQGPAASDGRSQDRSNQEGRPQGPAVSDGRSRERSATEGRGVTGAPGPTTSSTRDRRPTADGDRVKVPDRPEVGAATRYTDLRSGVAARVTVAEGDSLWWLAKRELGAQATNEQIAARWPEWYAANRQVIGTDPNLILPGQVLRVPPTSKEQ